MRHQLLVVLGLSTAMAVVGCTQATNGLDRYHPPPTVAHHASVVSLIDFSWSNGPKGIDVGKGVSKGIPRELNRGSAFWVLRVDAHSGTDQNMLVPNLIPQGKLDGQLDLELMRARRDIAAMLDRVPSEPTSDAGTDYGEALNKSAELLGTVDAGTPRIVVIVGDLSDQPPARLTQYAAPFPKGTRAILIPIVNDVNTYRASVANMKDMLGRRGISNVTVIDAANLQAPGFDVLGDSSR